MLTLALLFAYSIVSGSVFGENCPTAGTQCDAVCDIVYCPEEGGNPITIAKCSQTPDKKYCERNQLTGAFGCTADSCPTDPSIQHNVTCLGSGLFPSPYNCKTAYMCGQSGEPPISECMCGQNEIYEPTLRKCDVSLCPVERTPVNCKTAAESGKLPGVSGFCYVCDGSLDAMVYECPSSSVKYGKENDESRFQSCVPYVPPTSSAGPTSSTEPSTSPTPAPPVCHVANQRFPDPTDCHKYFVCDSSLKPQSKKCLSGYRYDEKKLSCVKGDCSNSVMSRE